jgi:hypothetical protein
MEPQDDPEARIRALEQPLADNARATELGTTTSYTTPNEAYLPPPLPSMPPQAQGPYPPPGYGTPWAPPPRKSSAGIPWLVFGIGAVVFMAIAGVVGFLVVNKSTREIPAIPGASIPSVPSRPSMPSMPAVPNMPSEPTAAPPGSQISVAGVGANKTIACDDSYVSVSGVSNTVTITGHCTTVTVSGMQNHVTLDESDEINASGFDNVVTFHSGSPDVNSGGSNVVQQG